MGAAAYAEPVESFAETLAVAVCSSQKATASQLNQLSYVDTIGAQMRCGPLTQTRRQGAKKEGMQYLGRNCCRDSLILNAIS